ncbi:MAG: TVP38/TMEM64 family protein, partial [Erysipelotrichaceae bacterium]|nr:TVP38/TMEM64 family protein [Erysipelotrichaceae bacterium]
EQFRDFGPLAPVFLALVESFIPALPLIAIVTFSTGAFGPYFGFLFSYIGSLGGSILVFLLIRKIVKPYFMHWVPKRKNLNRWMHWVSRQTPDTIIMLSAMPFTPSSLLNLTFGLSEFVAMKYIVSIAIGKFIMIGAMAMFGHTMIRSLGDPWVLLGLGLIYLVVHLLYRRIKVKAKLDEIEDEKKEE